MLTDDVDQASVLQVIRHVEYLATSEAQPSRMANNMSIREMLRVTAAAQILGMGKYTAHVYKKVEAQLRHGLPEYGDLDALFSLKNQHQRLFTIVCEKLAWRVREETISDHDVFDRIKSLNKAYTNSLRIAKDHNDRAQQAEQACIRREEAKERAVAEAEAREKREAARIQPVWDMKAVQEAEYERICLEQSRLPGNKRKKFSADVRLHWERTRGTKPPKGC
jgi:regulator of protease activity HflC (stomatin/prohibitin superfamily)